MIDSYLALGEAMIKRAADDMLRCTGGNPGPDCIYGSCEECKCKCFEFLASDQADMIVFALGIDLERWDDVLSRLALLLADGSGFDNGTIS
jgi:hypothetical protein